MITAMDRLSKHQLVTSTPIFNKLIGLKRYKNLREVLTSTERTSDGTEVGDLQKL